MLTIPWLRNVQLLTHKFASCPERCGIGVDIGIHQSKLVALTMHGTDCCTGASAVIDNSEFLPNTRTQSPEESTQTDTPENFFFEPKQLRQVIHKIADATQPLLYSQRRGIAATISMAVCELRTNVPTHEVGGSEKNANSDQDPNRLTGSYCTAALPSNGSTRQSRYLRVDEKLVTEIGNNLHSRGLTPNRIEGIPWALARAIEMISVDNEDRGIELILDWGFSRPTLILIQNGSLTYCRQLTCGSLQQILSPHIDDEGMSIAEAIRWLQLSFKPSSAGNPQPDLLAENLPWITDCVGQLAAEVNRAIDFGAWRSPKARVENLWCVGGGAEVPGLLNCLGNEVGIPLKPWAMQLSNRRLTPGFAAAASLAMEGLKYA